MIIPWKVDVPEERYPFVNWLIITGAIIAFSFQTLSILEQRAKLPDKIDEYRDRSVQDVAKDFEVEPERLREIEQSADDFYGRIEEINPQINTPVSREAFIKRIILQEYFVLAKIRPFILRGWKIKGLLGHIWLHGGILHLVGNMLFLWIFGNAVCAKIGNFRYLPVYLGLGLVAATAHLIFAGGNAIGASGAINGIVGMYLVFFPVNDITCYFVFLLLFRPIVKDFSLSSFWMILFWLAFDLWGAMSGGGRVAYFAHLGGFAGGFALGILMLKLKIVTMERYETSLLQAISDHFKKPDIDEFKPQYEGYLGMVQQQEHEPPAKIRIDPPQQETVTLEPERPKEEFIRFICPCGKKLKMPSRYVGRMGKCPQCQIRLKIPDK